MTTVNPPRPPQLDIHRILQVFPFRHPMVLVDRVTEVVPSQFIRGHKSVSYCEPWFQGQNRPVFPGMLILEALSQIGCILAYASEPFDPNQNQMYFLGLDKVKFRKTVVPGDRLDLHCVVMHHKTNIWKLHGEASVNGTLCAQGELLASIIDRTP